MIAMRCSACGATEFKKKNGLYICQYCGVQYERPVQMGTLSCNEVAESEISLDNDISDLLEKCKTNPWNAKKYANLILDIDPTNAEAKKYL